MNGTADNRLYTLLWGYARQRESVSSAVALRPWEPFRSGGILMRSPNFQRGCLNVP